MPLTLIHLQVIANEQHREKEHFEKSLRGHQAVITIAEKLDGSEKEVRYFEVIVYWRLNKFQLKKAILMKLGLRHKGGVSRR